MPIIFNCDNCDRKEVGKHDQFIFPASRYTVFAHFPAGWREAIGNKIACCIECEEEINNRIMVEGG